MAGRYLTVSAYLDRWVVARTKVVRPNTLSGYLTDLLHVERSGVGRIKLRALTAKDVERWPELAVGASRSDRATGL